MKPPLNNKIPGLSAKKKARIDAKNKRRADRKARVDAGYGTDVGNFLRSLNQPSGSSNSSSSNSSSSNNNSSVDYSKKTNYNKKLTDFMNYDQQDMNEYVRNKMLSKQQNKNKDLALNPLSLKNPINKNKMAESAKQEKKNLMDDMPVDKRASVSMKQPMKASKSMAKASKSMAKASKSILNLGTPYKMGGGSRGPLDKISNPIKGNAFIKAKVDAEARGDKSFEVGGKTYAVKMKDDSPMEASYSKGPKMPTPLNGYESDAQRKAVHASRADGGKGNPNKMKVPLMMPEDFKKNRLKKKITKLSDKHKDLYDRVIEGYGPSKPGERKKLYKVEDKLKEKEEKYAKKFGGSPYGMGHKK